MRTGDLTGPLLDYWAGRSNDDGREYLLSEDGRECLVRTGAITAERYSPSTDWSQGGPLLDKLTEVGETHVQRHAAKGYWVSVFPPNTSIWYYQTGETLLVAICRAYVRYKFGEEVDE